MTLVARFVNAFKGFVNMLISAISKFGGLLLSILPDSPFQSIIESVGKSDLLTTINWAIPFTTFISIGLAWTGAISVYYVITVGLRWVKAIE